MKATDRPWRPTANGERPESGIGSFGIFGEDELPLLGILPEQMASRRSLPEEWPLFEGVLAVAMYDLRGAGNRPRNRLRWKACEWVFDDDDAWVFSFVNVCRFLGLDIAATRSRLLKLEPDRFPRRPAASAAEAA